MVDDSEPGPQAAPAPPSHDADAAPEVPASAAPDSPLAAMVAPAPAPPSPPTPLLAFPPPLPAPASPWGHLGPLPPVTPPPAPVSHRPPGPRASTAFLVTVAFVSLVADLATKGWAKARLSGFDPKAHGPKKLELWKNHLDFIFAQNPGGAWSFLRGLPDTLRRPFFLVVSAAAIVFIVSIYRRVHREQTAMRWGLPLALGGAMGNLVDRIRYGWVVDFIDVSVRWSGRDHHWPTFNVADIAIVVGVALMALDMARARGVRIADDEGHPKLGSAPLT